MKAAALAFLAASALVQSAAGTHAGGTSGIASWYGEEHWGKIMANGQRFDPDALTCACWNYPLGTKLVVTRGRQSVVVTVTDRGPAKHLGRAIDLSAAAFRRLADPRVGLIVVRIQPLDQHRRRRCVVVGAARTKSP